MALFNYGDRFTAQWKAIGFLSGIGVFFLVMFFLSLFQGENTPPPSSHSTTASKSVAPKVKPRSEEPEEDAGSPQKEAAAAQDVMTLERVISAGGYQAGQVVDVVVTLNYTEKTPVTALGLVENLPNGWTYAGCGTENVPAIAPPPGSFGKLEFVWIKVPKFPLQFAYRLRVPEQAKGVQAISGSGIYRRLAGEERTKVVQTDISPVTP